MKGKMLCVSVVAAALAPAAFASPTQNDTIFFVGSPGNPLTNGCPSSSIYGSTQGVNLQYGAAAASDQDGNLMVCAIPLPDAFRDARFPGAPKNKALYSFFDQTG